MITRRNFLTHSCALGVATATVSSTLLSLGFARTAAAQAAPDYRALVCILLAGGNDSYNMLVPTDNDQFAEYAAIRTDLALQQNELLALPGTASNGRSYGVHPGMSELQSLFSNGEAAMIANVGTLLEAFDAQAVESGIARLPLGLFSHADQINQWQTAAPDARIAQGWGGRIADLMQGANVQNGVSMNISLSGSNVFQSGNQVSEYSIEAAGDVRHPPSASRSLGAALLGISHPARGAPSPARRPSRLRRSSCLADPAPSASAPACRSGRTSARSRRSPCGTSSGPDSSDRRSSRPPCVRPRCSSSTEPRHRFARRDVGARARGRPRWAERPRAREEGRR